ncbi:MAG: hypothetical protein RJA09_667 [Pseudomonadota bacterium]|jgi:Asp-tRNA(Asn)/Glu-tRNA(Gln) amidotransferase B subunit
MKPFWSLIPLAFVSQLAFAQQADPAEVDAVVAAVKAANPDMKAVCQKGPDGIRKTVTDVVMASASAGKIKSNPMAVGGEAGQKIGRECRGG